jgi:MinD-like ATPase involved in chromosome partitioning or flagellar assembly
MIVAVASMKGGVGKTTISAMLARYITDRQCLPVTILDMDPQRGSTIIMLGPRAGINMDPPTIVDILATEMENIPSSEVFAQAMRKSPYNDKIFVVPAHKELTAFMQGDVPTEILRWAIESSPLAPETTIIIDTGSAPTLCEMSVAAADIVFIPITMSHQSGLPTANTLKTALIHGTTIGGIIPVMSGEAGWEVNQLDKWREKLMASEALRDMGVRVLENIPYSRHIIRGRWRWGKIPDKTIPALEDMYNRILEVEIGEDDKEGAKELLVAGSMDQV